MGDKSNIEWTDATLNAVRGCQRVSKACMNCYAERMASRFCDEGQPYEGIAIRTNKGPRWTGKLMFIEEKLDQLMRWKRPRMVFVDSMSDLFWEEVSDEVIKKHFYAMHEANHHTYQILTKRPERMAHFLNYTYRQHVGNKPFPTDYQHVWLGTSIEDQPTADERIRYLQDTPAAVRFLSIEPLLGLIDLNGMLDGISWVIVGGESGPGARPMHPGWVRKILNQCAEAGVPFFMKQWGAWLKMSWDPNDPASLRDNECYLNLNGTSGLHGPGVIKMKRVGKKKAGCLLDGKEWKEMPGDVRIRNTAESN